MAAHLPEGQAQFEYVKMQLIGSLGAVAETMRNCATFADQFSQLISPITYPGAPMLLPNGQLPPMPPPHAMEPIGGKRKAPGDEVEGKKKRKSKPKDPLAPKRPPSSYLLFQNEIRQELKQKHPGVTNNELLAMISHAWSEMPKERKDTYEDRQRAAKDAYLARKAQYENKLNGTAPPAPVDVPQPVAVLPPEAAVSPESAETSESSSEEGDDDSDKGSNASDDDQPSPKKVKLEPKSEDKKARKSKTT